MDNKNAIVFLLSTSFIVFRGVFWYSFYMKNLIKRAFGFKKTVSRKMDKSISIEKKVDQGTAKAIKEYGYVFKKLAEFDKA